jgi:16S rRNA (cytidine1402-2'-O)-methyltransferase
VGGILFVVATPIGNLEDVTFRAIRILREVDQIACEDTRHTRRLLEHYGITNTLVSYHEHNEAARTKELVENLRGGKNVAVVSDAGTPLISDPGYRLVQAAIAEGIRVEAIPGPSAVLTALAASGLSTDSFYFGGFLPPKQMARRRRLEELASMDATLIFYEAPHRILETLADCESALSGRPLVLCRELTKLHEEILRGSASEISAALRAKDAIRGEITLLAGKRQGAEERPSTPEAIAAEVRSRIDQGVSRMDAMKEIARRYGMSKREVYDAMEESE